MDAADDNVAVQFDGFANAAINGVAVEEDDDDDAEFTDEEDGDVAEFADEEAVNKSVLWDLEAPILGSFFDKYQLANADRAAKVASDVSHFAIFMDPVLDVDFMKVLSKKEAQARLRERLELLQLRKTKYQEIMGALESAANDFRNCVQLLEYCWDTKRLDRVLVNHLLRTHCIDTAYKLALERDIQVLFDFEPFHEADHIVNALRNKDLGPAQAWCSKNTPWGKLNFELFCQQFIEYVRSNEKMVAISFAWKHALALWDHKKELLQVLSAVAFGCNTQILRYKKLLEEERWDFLIKLFWEEFEAKHLFTWRASSLCILLESGIIALKVPYPYCLPFRLNSEFSDLHSLPSFNGISSQPAPFSLTPCSFCLDGEDCKRDDPLQHEYFQTFASTLPHARHSFPPKLVCHGTKKPLGEQNPPYMLPNGYAYSEEAISGMRDGDQITCLRTGFVCNISDVKALELKAYIQTIPLA